MNYEHTSAGGVVVNKDRQILLLHRNQTENWLYDSWHLPKGTQHPGETLEETALREVEEETGYKVKILDKIGELPSTYEREGKLVNKLTHYFLMKPISEQSPHDPEHDEVAWVNFDFAREKLVQFPIWEKEQDILEVAQQKL